MPAYETRPAHKTEPAPRKRAGEEAGGCPGGAGTSGPLQPAIRVMMLPRDTNAMGTIFGGIILSYIDVAGAVEAHRYAPGKVVTAAIHGVDFHAPVFVGDLVSFHTETVRCGRTSVTVKVTVEVERRHGAEPGIKVTEAELVYVHIDDRNRPIPILPPA